MQLNLIFVFFVDFLIYYVIIITQNYMFCEKTSICNSRRSGHLYWYIIHAKSGKSQELVNFFNREEDIYAFLPMVEKWFSNSQMKMFKDTYMYPNYIFVKSLLERNLFHEKYEKFFQTIDHIAELVVYDDVIALNNSERLFLEKMFGDQNVIKHSVGNIHNSVLKIDEGPLVGLEERITKIDRHKRLAFLDFPMLGNKMKVPLEVISKS